MATRKAAKKKSRRTVMYSSGGKKLYAGAGCRWQVQRYPAVLARARDGHQARQQRRSRGREKGRREKGCEENDPKDDEPDRLGKAVKGAVQRAIKRTREGRRLPGQASAQDGRSQTCEALAIRSTEPGSRCRLCDSGPTVGVSRLVAGVMAAAALLGRYRLYTARRRARGDAVADAAVDDRSGQAETRCRPTGGRASPQRGRASRPIGWHRSTPWIITSTPANRVTRASGNSTCSAFAGPHCESAEGAGLAQAPGRRQCRGHRYARGPRAFAVLRKSDLPALQKAAPPFGGLIDPVERFGGCSRRRGLSTRPRQGRRTLGTRLADCMRPDSARPISF